MLAISVEFLHGTYRADPDGGATTGRAELGEWPPSVARLLAAFVAADGMGDDCRITNGTELEFLERLGAPVIHAEPQPVHQPLHPRYVVLAAGPVRKIGKDYPSGHQEYPARTGALVRPGVRIALRHPIVHYVWQDADPSDSLEALRLRAARIGYLGCADSPVRVRVKETLEDDCAESLHAFCPDPAGTRMVSVPRPGRHLSALQAAYDAWQEHGAATARSQFPALRNLVAYTGPEDVSDMHEAGRVVAWLRFNQSVPGRRIGDVTAALKAAAMSRYQRLYGDPIPRVLHGHGYEDSGYEIARYLALPNVGFDRSGGQIHGAAVWLPRVCDETTVERAQAAARSIELLQTAALRVGVAPWQGEDRPRSATPRRWQQRSEAWATAVPAIHERFGKLDLPELRRWCRHAGLPEPVWFLSARVPLVPGALALHPTEVNRRAPHATEAARPYSHIKVRFAEAVRGPIVIGGGRSRGFGLCVPINTADTRNEMERRGERDG